MFIVLISLSTVGKEDASKEKGPPRQMRNERLFTPRCVRSALCVAFLALRIQQGCRCIRSHPPLSINPSSGGLSPKEALCYWELPRPRVSSETRPGADTLQETTPLSTHLCQPSSKSFCHGNGWGLSQDSRVQAHPRRPWQERSSATEGPEDPGSEEGRVRQS